MSAPLEAKYTPAFSRDLKRGATRHKWDLTELEGVVALILDNSIESQSILKTRHNMHRLSGKWSGCNECHVANICDWLVIWRVHNGIAYFQRTGTHKELFR